MYKKEKPIGLKGSTSSLCNNLSVYIMPDKRQLNYCVIHKSVISIASATADGSSVTGRQIICKEPSATQGVPFVVQSKWVFLPIRTVLVFATQRSIQIYEPDGSAMIFWHALTESQDKCNFGKGIAGVGDNLICVGTQKGAILIFEIPPKGTGAALIDSISGHNDPISALASDVDTVISGDDIGVINVWKFSGSRYTQTSSIKGSGWPCNSLALWRDIIVAGFGSGHLRIFNATDGKIGAEVTAHARGINAIDVSKENGMVISVSDDTFFRVWQLKKGPVPQIEHRTSQCVTDLQLVGGQFVDGQGRALCLTGYDNNEISFYVQG